MEKIKLGRKIVIPAEATAERWAAESTHKFFTPVLEVTIGIGNDHSATLYIPEDGWKALQDKNNEIHI